MDGVPARRQNPPVISKNLKNRDQWPNISTNNTPHASRWNGAPWGVTFFRGRAVRFAKPATTFDEQIDLLIGRGMEIPDRDRARHYLAHLNYYRLGAYWLPFEADHATHRFRPGTRFEDVVGLYVFDRELRLLVMDAIERLEVSVRTQWAYHLAHAYDPHAHMEALLVQAV